MRKIYFVTLISFGLASFPLISSAQHAMAPAVAPPAVHAAPMHVAPMHAVPAAGVHSAPARSNVHASAQVRNNVRTATPPAKSAGSSTTSSGSSWHPFPHPPNTLPTFPPQVPNAPALLPGNIFSGQSCFSPLSCYAVPGFGFDYEHFFAVHPNWGTNILTAGVVLPVGGIGGFYMPIPYYTGPPQPEEAPPSAPEQPEGNHGQQAVAEQAPPAPVAQNFYALGEPVSEYVFVKRDGTRIFAVAYSLTKDKVQYITKEGLRRSLSLDALDFAATQKSNEERGNTITLPAPPPSAMAQVS